MKNVLWSFILLLCLFFCPRAYGQLQAFLIPEILKKDAHAVVRYDNMTFKIENEGKAILTNKYAVTCLDEKGQHVASFALKYNKLRKIKNISGALYDAAGKKVQSLKKEDVTDHGDFSESFYDDYRAKSASFTHNIYPFTVEFEYELEFNGLFNYPDWNPQTDAAVSVAQASFTVVAPKGFEIRYLPILLNEPTQIFHEEKNDRYEWKVSLLKASKEEVLTADNENHFPRLRLAPVKFEIEGYKGEMSSWKSYGQFINKLNAGRDEITPALKAKAAELTADCKDDRCKVEKIYNYLQNTTHYISVQLGIGSWQPIKAADVEAHKYGDCKALTNYMQAMLKSVGIPSIYTLVFAGDVVIPIQKDFPDNQFNHAFVCVPLQNDTIWLECTSQTRSVGYLGNWTDDRDVLLVSSEGGKVVHTPVYTISDNFRNTAYQLRLDETGGAQMESSIFYNGVMVDQVSRLTEKSADEQKKWILENIELPGFDVQSINFQFAKGRTPNATQKYALKMEKYGSKSGKRIFFYPNALNRFKIPDFGDSARTSPIQVSKFDYAVADTALIQIPANYAVESMPENKEYHSVFGDYKATYEKLPDGSIRFIRTRTCLKTIQPKEKYAELKEYMKKVATADAAKIALVSKT